jgi:hypothetical protein
MVRPLSATYSARAPARSPMAVHIMIMPVTFSMLVSSSSFEADSLWRYRDWVGRQEPQAHMLFGSVLGIALRE